MTRETDLLSFLDEILENIKAALLKFEDLKNHYNGLLMDFMYSEGAKNGVMILRLLLNLIFFQDF